jgi:hypothetical protein
MRKWLFVGLAVALMLASILLAVVMPRHCPVNHAAFERIKAGMTQAEDHAILGGPPGDYLTRPTTMLYYADYGVEFPEPPCRGEYWSGDEGQVFVTFTPRGIVSRVAFLKAPPHNPGLVAKARWRLEPVKERRFP